MHPPLAAFPVGDVGVVGLLAAFALWGAWRGTLRQLLTLGLLGLAFPIATRYGPRIEESVVKAVSASGADVRAIAWLVVFAGVLVAGGVILALLQPLLGKLRPGGRATAALLGLVHGAVVVTVLGYAVLLGSDGSSPHVRLFERGPAVQAMQLVAQGVRAVVPLPPWLEKRLDAVDRRVDALAATSRLSVAGGSTAGTVACPSSPRTRCSCDSVRSLPPPS